MKSGVQLEKENWPKLMESTNKKIELAFKGILQTMTKKQIDKSVVETEADKTRLEMLNWASQVSSGRIQIEKAVTAWNPEELEVVEETNEPIF